MRVVDSRTKRDDCRATRGGAFRVHLIDFDAGAIDTGTGRAQPLVRPMRGLFGHDTPIGVLTADGSTLLYNSWEELVDWPYMVSADQVGIETGDPVARPSIRAARLGASGDAGDDVLVVDGAQTVAVDGDGRIAYMEGDDPDYRLDLRYLGQVVVQQGLDGTPEPWTHDPQKYEVLAWAGRTLLVQRPLLELEGGGDLLALDGPGQVRVLAPSTSLVAVRPDGAAALVADVPHHDALDEPVGVRVVDVRTGETLQEVDLRTPDGEVLTWVSHGSWVGDQVVVDAGIDQQGVLAVLTIDAAGTAVVSTVLRFETDKYWGPSEPFFTSDGASVGGVVSPAYRFSAPPEVERRPHRLLLCSIATGTCRLNAAVALAGKQAARAHNPSRPLPATGGVTLPSESL